MLISRLSRSAGSAHIRCLCLSPQQRHLCAIVISIPTIPQFHIYPGFDRMAYYSLFLTYALRLSFVTQEKFPVFLYLRLSRYPYTPSFSLFPHPPMTIKYEADFWRFIDGCAELEFVAHDRHNARLPREAQAPSCPGRRVIGRSESETVWGSRSISLTHSTTHGRPTPSPGQPQEACVPFFGLKYITFPLLRSTPLPSIPPTTTVTTFARRNFLLPHPRTPIPPRHSSCLAFHPPSCRKEPSGNIYSVSSSLSQTCTLTC